MQVLAHPQVRGERVCADLVRLTVDQLLRGVSDRAGVVRRDRARGDSAAHGRMARDVAGDHRGAAGECLHDGIRGALGAARRHEHVRGRVQRPDVVGRVEHVHRVAEPELFAKPHRRLASADRDAHRLDSTLAQRAHRVQEQVAALAVPVPAEVHQQRLVGRKPEAQACDLALLALQQPEPVDVHGVVHELDARPRGSAVHDDLGQLGADAQDALDPAAQHGVLQAVAGPHRQAVVVGRVDVPEDLGAAVPFGRHRGRDVEAREVRVQDRGLVALAQHRAHQAGDVRPRVRRREPERDPVVAQLVQPDAILRDRSEHGLTCPAAVPGGAHHSAQHRDERTGIGPSVACQMHQTHLVQANPTCSPLRV